MPTTKVTSNRQIHPSGTLRNTLRIDIKRFIEGDLGELQLFLERLHLLELPPLSEEDYTNDLAYLQDLKSVDTKDPRCSRIHVALAMVKLMSPNVADHAEAISYLDAPINQEDPLAKCLKGSCLLSERGIKKDEPAGFRYFQEASQKGCHIAICCMGYCYKHGIGVAKNPAKAYECFRRAKEAGSADAIYQLGYCYQFGIGVDINPYTAYDLYRLGSEAGSAAATNGLGYCYQHGIGVAKNPTKTYESYRRASEAGSLDATINLGFCYQHGIGVAKNPTKTYESFCRASEAGSAAAFYYLGYCYQHGIGVADDLPKAFNLYIQAILSIRILMFIKESIQGIQSILSILPITAIDIVSLAKCFANVYEKFPSELEDVQQLATLIFNKCKNYEARFWAFLICYPTGPNRFDLFFKRGPVFNFIAENPGAFIENLFKDDVHSYEQKKIYFRLVFENFSKQLNGRHELLLRKYLGQLDVLRNPARNPNSFFTNITTELLETFAEGKSLTLAPEPQKEKEKEKEAVPARASVQP